MARAKKVASIDIDAPGSLDMREFAAFRLGVLKTLLRVSDDPTLGFEIPGIYRLTFEEEILYREQQLAESE